MEGDEAEKGLNFTPVWSVSGSITPRSHNDKRERFTRDETKLEKGDDDTKCDTLSLGYHSAKRMHP